jgi:predicted Zn-dependent protease
MNLKCKMHFLLCFTLGLDSCAAPSPKEKQHDEYQQLSDSLKQEKEVGRQMAAKLAGLFGIYDNLNATLYVNLVGLTVAAGSSRPEITYRFGVLKSEEVNAFATPGGYIFVTTALIKSLRNESELAGILGHEIAHVTQKHMYQAIAPKREVTVAETMTRLLSRGASDLGLSIGKIVNAGMELLLETGLGPEKESDADAVGATFAQTAGYDTGSYLEYLKFLGAQSTTVKVSKTHPPFPERIAALNSYLQKNGILKKGEDRDGVRQVRFKKAISGLQSGTPAVETSDGH